MLIQGLIIIIDLDNFGEYVEKHGLDPYKPNVVTGTLSELVYRFVNKWRGVVIYGLDFERGTEEAVIELPYGHENIDDILKDLLEIKEEINKLGVSISIVVVQDYVYPELAGDRRIAYKGTVGRIKAWKILRKIKKTGGNKIVFV